MRDELSFPFDLTTPSVARTKLAAFLTRHQITGDAFEHSLIVLSELIANAVNHGNPTREGNLAVAWEVLNDAVHIQVGDGGVTKSLEPFEFDTDSLNGRGLAIVNRLSQQWWVDHEPTTTVHARIAF